MTDLGPLAWVLDELRKALGNATRGLRRYIVEASGLPGNEGGAGLLRTAEQHLHQAAGALNMVDQVPSSRILRAMEAAVHQCVLYPERCNEDAVACLERAGFGLLHYLESVLHGRTVSAVVLFPHYRDVQLLAAQDRAHPADLWSLEWHWKDPVMPVTALPLLYEPAVRTRFEQAVLKLIKTRNGDAAQALRNISLGFVAAQSALQPRVFWKVSAGFFEALSLGLCPNDVYVKRASSRILQQYSALVRGELGVAEQLVRDLVFFCAQASVPSTVIAPTLKAVQQGFELADWQSVNYEHCPFGHFDPALLVQARKRIGAAKEAWSAVAGGELVRIRGLSDQFNLVADSLIKLHPPSTALAAGLIQASDFTVHSGVAPSAELAMEVATSVMFLEAAFEELDSVDTELTQRTERLAHRLLQVISGGAAEPLEPWIEALYRRVSDRQTMGSVVGELRTALADLERLLDQYFRDPKNSNLLVPAPMQLSQMRGVLSVLGLDQAVRAVIQMRVVVEGLIGADPDDVTTKATDIFDKLGNNLGTLGLMFDMLNYQPVLAKKLFIFDEVQGELRSVMGRALPQLKIEDETPKEALAAEDASLAHESTSALLHPNFADTNFISAGSSESVDFPEFQQTTIASLALEPSTESEADSAHSTMLMPPDSGQLSMELSALMDLDLPQTYQAPDLISEIMPIPLKPVDESAVDFDEDDLLGIFLEEAREVVCGGSEAIEVLTSNPGDVEQHTILRRAFHTLKGSSRMVGLSDFGDAAWSFEQLHNTWLADRQPATHELRELSRQALQGLSDWAQDIAEGDAGRWNARPFQNAADALRLHNRFEAIQLPNIGFTIEQAKENFAHALQEAPSLDMHVDMPASAPETATVTVNDALPLLTVLEPMSGEVPDSTGPATVEPAQAEALLAVDESNPSEMPILSFSDAEAAEIPLALDDQEVDVPLSTDTDTDADIQAEFDAEVAVPALVSERLGGSPTQSMIAADPLMSGFGSLELDEETKVIGNLRIGIPLYNVYLNEADEWSRRLLTELTEWELELRHRRLGESTVALAHSLAGSSATVGFTALSGLARELEHALERTFLQSRGSAEEGRVYTSVAEDIRRLLHQFAAGFLKEPNPEILDELRQLHAYVVPGLTPIMSDSVELPVVAASDAPATTSDALPAQPALTVPVTKPELIPQARTVLPYEPLVTADDVEIEVVDVLDPDLFQFFEEEASDLLPMLSGALRQWVARPDNSSAKAEVLRVLHTLKGSARLAGAMRLGERAHRMETVIEYLEAQGLSHDAEHLEALLARFDGLQTNFENLRLLDAATVADVPGTPNGNLNRDDLSQASDAFESATDKAVDLTDNVGLPVAMPTDAGETPRSDEPASSAVSSLARPLSSLVVPVARAAAGQAVRIRSQLVDRMVNQTGEVMMTRSRLEAGVGQLRSSLGDLNANLERLRHQLRDIELQAELQMQSRLAQTKDSERNFDPLEFDRFTRVQELTRMMAESVNDVATVQRNLQRTLDGAEVDLVAQARQTRELQRDLLRTRMLEFETIVERLYRVVRQAAKDTGKQVKLDITGGSIEMDRGVLDRMTPAFEHLLRNAVAHGVESPEQRNAAGKPVIGTISIKLQQAGNDVSIAFSDDGAGLNRARIRDKALTLGLITTEQTLGADDLLNLIFMPGFSTASHISELSGRGIGMDVVRSEVLALGGRIESSSEIGVGAVFNLVLPLTTAVTQVVMVRAGQLSFGVPANVVEQVCRTSANDLREAYNRSLFNFDGEDIPFFWSGALLQSSPRSEQPLGKTASVVVFRSAQQRLALHVDEVLGNQEVVVKNLGPQLSRLPGLSGMTVLASGAVVLIYNPVALASVYGPKARRFQSTLFDGTSEQAPAAPVLSQVPLVLVVDDSITVRRVTQRLLQREGYRVALAVDGIQALERLRDETPAVMLSDIEMPRMDGFELARSVRVSAAWKSLPIISISSRTAEKHRQLATEIGINHYLGKPYGEEELLSLIRRYAKPVQPEQVGPASHPVSRGQATLLTTA